MSHETLSGNWNYPTRIRAGAGRIAELAKCCSFMGMEAPLLVTDPGLAALPLVEEALARCRDAGLAIGLFSGVKSNPTGANVLHGVDVYRDGGHDGVIAFGGGSALDAGKTIALMAGQTGDLWDYEDKGENWKRVDEAGMAPVVAVPTTAGTGSEAGRASVILDEEAHVKKIIFHPAMLPGLVILDPELTVGLPANLTAATGMDALAHSLEAWCAPGWHPLADGIALEGMRLVHDYLPRAFREGSDIEARSQMMAASTMGSTAFQKGLGAIHALSHPLGALYDAHHGTLNAIVMPYVLEANRDVVAGRLARAARYIDLETGTYESFLEWVLTLRREIGIPHTLADIGIGEDRLDAVGRMAVEDPTAPTNPVRLDADEYAALCGRAVRGEL